MSFTIEYATSADGTRVGFERTGQGPTLVVVHGGLRSSEHYRALAESLAGRFTVVLTNRRGRALNAPEDRGAGIETELADLDAVMSATNAELLFGHSAGAIVSLELALRRPPRKLALFEPPVNVRRHLDIRWTARLDDALAAKRYPMAMAVAIQGLQMGPPFVPPALFALPLRVLFRTASGPPMARLLETLPRDLAMVSDLDPDLSRYRRLTMPMLLLAGAKSPRYLHACLDDLRAAVPSAERVELRGLGHNGPDLDDPPAVARALGNFLAA